MASLWRRNNSTSDTNQNDSEEKNNVSSSTQSDTSIATTAPKGRPTPKRSSKVPRRGPIAPAPLTASQARSRRKALAGPKLTSQQRRERKAEQRQQMEYRRSRMLAGDEAFLLSRDRGPVRRLTRNLVDARYNLLTLFTPTAFILIVAMLFTHDQHVQMTVSFVMIALMVLMLIDSIILGIQVVRVINKEFPKNTESRFRLALYAISRASTIRRMRVPRPQVSHGHQPY